MMIVADMQIPGPECTQTGTMDWNWKPSLQIKRESGRSSRLQGFISWRVPSNKPRRSVPHSGIHQRTSGCGVPARKCNIIHSSRQSFPSGPYVGSKYSETEIFGKDVI